MAKRTMTKRELRKLWESEKESYKEQEVGTGVQTFVKHVLESEEIFNLKEGKLKTKVDRENEFIYEKKTKQGRRADFVIFINSEIIIPIEVERYENIEAGIEQIANYQKDLDKKYGILTDGYTWRFYNNNKFIVWNLDAILSTDAKFEDFWTDYIKPRNYYLSFFVREEDFQGEKSLSVEENRERFFDDITHLIRSLRNRLEIKKYFNGIDDKEKEKKATETSYAYVIQFILYKALVDNEFADFKEKFGIRIEHIGKALNSESYKETLNYIIGVSDRISEDIYKPFSDEQGLINRRIRRILGSLESRLSDITPWLDIFVFIKKYNFANIQNEIFGYVYENYLKELYEEEQKGQYFTDPAVVNFMLQQVGYTSEYIKGKVENGELGKLSIIDPACGSGTFLYKAVDEIIKSFSENSKEISQKIEEIITNNIFGLDIAEFPLYLAEMSILMRLLPYIVGEKYNNPVDKKIKVFWTKDSISEFIFDNITNTKMDVKEGELYHDLFVKTVKPETPSFIRDDENLDEMKKSMQIPRRRFDFVVANPPYIGYNQCSKQGILITKLIQAKRVPMSNIYGVNLNTVPGLLKGYAPKPNLYAFFLALGLALLKDNGKLCFIIPQTVLTANDLDVVRYYLSKYTTIDKIINFRRNLFIKRGINQQKVVPTSSLVLVLTKKQPEKEHKVEVFNYLENQATIKETLLNIIHNRKTIMNSIYQKELYDNIINWNYIRHTKKTIEFINSYNENSDSIDMYRDYDISREKFGDIFVIDGSFNIPTKSIQRENPHSPDDFYNIPVLKSDGYFIREVGYYPKNTPIKAAKGGQGLKVVNTEFKIIWHYVNPKKFYFIDGHNVLPRFQHFAIGSNNRYEIIYLLALLNSPISKFVFESLLMVENEKDILVGIRAIRNYFRVPYINKSDELTKKEIVISTDFMLSLEHVFLSDFVDFSSIMLQKFDKVSVIDGKLFLVRGDRKLELPIKENPELVASVIEEKYSNYEGDGITLSELKNLPVIDFEKQAKLKDYIDDLVFALYFNVELEEIGFENAAEIKEKCRENRFYSIIESIV